tara:strand:+ start:241 stop:681 length:441 start_codon:yes stop_codon:yes gene_type:complete
MKDKIINMIAVLVMVGIANYPVYKNLKDTAREVNSVLNLVQGEIASWKKDVNAVQEKVENLRNELVVTINKGISHSDSVLSKIKDLELEAKNLSIKIDSLKIETVNKVKKAIEPDNINKKIDSLKIDVKKDVEKIIDFKSIMKFRG